MTPTPDTSNANVARVLRSDAINLDHFEPGLGAVPRALADALDAAPTWEERVKRGVAACAGGFEWNEHYETARAEATLRAAFPDLAPPTAPSEPMPESEGWDGIK